MPLDTRIPLGVQAPQLDLAAAMEKGMSMRRMNMQNQAMESEQGDRMAMGEALKRYSKVDKNGRMSVDSGAAMSALSGKIDPQRQMAFQKQLDDMDTDTLRRVSEQAKQFAWSVTPENYAQKRQEAIENGMMNAEKLPEFYSPQSIERMQLATLEGEKQLQYRMQQEQSRERSLDRAESRAERRSLAGQRQELAKEQKIERNMQNLSKDVAGTQGLFNALDEVESELGGPLEEFKVSGNGLSRDGKAVDLPGLSLPGIGRVSIHSTKAQNLASRAAAVFNTTLKDRSGGAVTDNEMERLKREFSEGKWNSESQLVEGLQAYKRQVAKVLKNREAAYAPEVVERYTDQGGRTSRTMPAFETSPIAGGGGIDFDKLGDADLDALVEQTMQKQAVK